MPPNRSTRCRLRFGCCSVFVAKDFFVGFGLFCGIIALGVLYFGFVIPYALTIGDSDLSKPGMAGVAALVIAYGLHFSFAITSVLFISTEGLLLFLLVADPGIVSEPDWFVAGEACPPDTDCHYCPQCNVWIEGFDHHCGIVGACIGAKTMPIFITFLGSAAILLLYGLVFVLVPVLGVQFGRGDIALVWRMPPLAVPAAVAVSFAAVYLGLYCAMLCGWYSMLACRGQFTLTRRRRLLMPTDPSSPEPGCTMPHKKYDLNQPCKCSNFMDMLRNLPDASIARQ